VVFFATLYCSTLSALLSRCIRLKHSFFSLIAFCTFSFDHATFFLRLLPSLPRPSSGSTRYPPAPLSTHSPPEDHSCVRRRSCHLVTPLRHRQLSGQSSPPKPPLYPRDSYRPPPYDNLQILTRHHAAAAAITHSNPLHRPCLRHHLFLPPSTSSTTSILVAQSEMFHFWILGEPARKKEALRVVGGAPPITLVAREQLKLFRPVRALNIWIATNSHGPV
jgi:hypothetical protein